QKDKKMKAKSIIGMLALVMAASSCTVQSLHPLYDEKTMIYEPCLEGEWIDDDGNSWVIKRAQRPDANQLKKELVNPKAYQITYHGDSVETNLDACMVKLDGTYFIDLFPAENYDKEIGNDILLGNLLPVHTFSKVETQDDSLYIYQFDSEWLSDLIKNNQIRISHEVVKAHGADRVVLTAPTNELQKFVAKYHNDPKAFSEPDKFVRKRR
ncbi:MAG: hypothetical protein RIE59_23940, partial [Imperialibacter sp.]